MINCKSAETSLFTRSIFNKNKLFKQSRKVLKSKEVSNL